MKAGASLNSRSCHPKIPPMTALSILDLAPVPEGSDVSRALANTLDRARHAEPLGYRRYWLAEHHNRPGVASAAATSAPGLWVCETVVAGVRAGDKGHRVPPRVREPGATRQD